MGKMKDASIDEADKELESLASHEDKDKIDKIAFTGEIFLRDRVDEETKKRKYSVAIVMNNPFVELFEGGYENEFNRQLGLGFKENKGKVKAQFVHKAKQALNKAARIGFDGYIERRKFYDRERYKSVKYIGIFIKSPLLFGKTIKGSLKFISE